MYRLIRFHLNHGRIGRLFTLVLLVMALAIMFEPVGGSKRQVCGDTNGDGRINNNDLLYLIYFLFWSGPPPSPGTADVDCNGAIEIADVIYFVNAIFQDGPEVCAGCP